jgi:hypothetical protein
VFSDGTTHIDDATIQLANVTDHCYRVTFHFDDESIHYSPVNVHLFDDTILPGDGRRRTPY